MADSLAEMVKSLKPGVRVQRGRDWNYGDIDGNGEGKLNGTFMHEGRVLFKVIWDCGNVEYALRMDAGKYDLQIVDFAMPSTEKPVLLKEPGPHLI